MTADQIDQTTRRQGVYSIAVVSEMVGVGIQTLRLYETKGLIEPARSAGGTRRYSEADVETLRRVALLLAGGVNLAGARRIIELEDANDALRALIPPQRHDDE